MVHGLTYNSAWITSFISETAPFAVERDYIFARRGMRNMSKRTPKKKQSNPLHEDQDQFDKWTRQWEKAMSDGVFDDAPKLPQPAYQSAPPDFFGQNPTVDLPPVNIPDAEYWRQVYGLSKHSGQAPDLLQEQVDSPVERRKGRNVKAEGDIAKYYSKIARSDHPIVPTSVGKDQAPVVTQNWGVGGKEVDRLSELKLQLHDLESKLNALEGVGEVKNSRSMQQKLDRLRNEIDEFSDSLNFPAPFDPQADY